ncbi:FAD/NAD(P)-binding protein [Kineococcus siccus]|uniref:FAD/NAD(P)-binding protein n=1 Tax=Kineococcus siccus TaxID=2696567 RepID=UPI0030B81CFD
MTAIPTARRPVPTPLVLCFVGAGPRTLGVLERLGADAPALLGERPLVVHVVDPHLPGAGRIWREDQHPLLLMNSRAADVTVLPDASSVLRGPLRGGPTLFAWLDGHRDELAARFAAAGRADLAAEVREVGPHSFVSRALGSAYLRWAWDVVLAGLPTGTDVQVHASTALDVVDAAGGRQLVHLAGRAEPLAVDGVVLAQGHADVLPGPRERALQAFAAAHDLVHVAPGYTSDLHTAGALDVLEPGADVLVLGMGLAFVDVVLLLTQGRGGRFERDASGDLHYRPSGAEPVLHAGSRRGVPYRSKISYELASRPPLPRFLTLAAVTQRRERLGRPLDLRADVWPLIAKELAGAHYHELFLRHPERTRTTAAEFDRAFAAAEWGTPAFDELVARAVPDAEDRLDLAALDRPLEGFRAASAAAVDARVHDHVVADTRRRADPAHSADAAVFAALLSCYGVVAAAQRHGLLTARSAALDVDGWWHGFFSYVASGPPPGRLEQLAALARAGVLRFLGAGTTVEADAAAGRWVATSASSPARLRTRAFVDARLPHPSTRDTADPLLQRLHARGEAVEQEFDDGTEVLTSGRLVVDAGQHLVDAAGRPHPRRFAVGPWVAGNGWAPAFARPGVDAGFFRLNEAVARGLLAVRPAETAGVSAAVRPGARTGPSAGAVPGR